MRYRLLQAILSTAIVLLAHAIWTANASAQQMNISTPADSDTGEGCILHPYTGTLPLNKLAYYFQGEEDLRAGMTCRFRIHPDLPVFTFHFPGKSDNTLGDIEIIPGPSGRAIQTIENSTEPGLAYPASVKDVFSVVDANFDGYEDLKILIQCGGTGNCSYNFYLYDPKSGQFVLNKFLSDLTTPSFDHAKKQVTATANGSANDWTIETYQYGDGKYTLIRRETSEWDREKKVVTVSIDELRNGKMERVSSESNPE
jgi:hypothetical protein